MISWPVRRPDVIELLSKREEEHIAPFVVVISSIRDMEGATLRAVHSSAQKLHW